MFQVVKEKLYVTVPKNHIAHVVVSESFLDEFLQWANDFLLVKAKRHEFKKNILRHIGPASNYAGRQNILNILHALYQYANYPDHENNDLKSSIVSRIEERAMNCTPGFETGLCDMAQTIFAAPKSLEGILQLVRENIIKKNAMVLTDDVHGQNEVFRLAGPIWGVDMANHADPYTGNITLHQIQVAFNRDFEVFYHSIKLIDALKEQFFSVIQGFGYVENQIDILTHTKIKDFIQTIFIHHPQVINLKKAQSYHDKKKEFEKHGFVMVLALLTNQGYFDLTEDEQQSRLNSLMGEESPDWLSEELYDEWINFRAIESPIQRQQEIEAFFYQNQLFRIDVYLQHVKTKAAYERANVPPSQLVWANALPSKLLAEINLIHQQTEILIGGLEKPMVTLADASVALDEYFWFEDEHHDFPYQGLNSDKILMAFFHELKNREAVVVHPWLEMIGFSHQTEHRSEIIFRMLDHAGYRQGMKYLIDLLATISIYADLHDPLFQKRFQEFCLTWIHQTRKNNLPTCLLHLCVDFKIALPMLVLMHPNALSDLEPQFFMRVLRCLQEKDKALQYIEAYFHEHEYVMMPYKKLLNVIMPELRLEFLQKYTHFFIKNPTQLIEALKKLPQPQRLSLMKLHQHLLDQITPVLFISIFDLLSIEDKFELCIWINSFELGVWMDKAVNLSVIKKLRIQSRYIFISSILGPEHTFFEALIVETFHLWRKKDKLSFLKENEWMEQFSLPNIEKIILKAPVSLLEKRQILDTYLAKQHGHFEPFYLFKFEQLLKNLGLNENNELMHYSHFIIRNAFSHAEIFSRMLQAFNDNERYAFLISLPPEFKEALVKQQLIGKCLLSLLPSQRMQYLSSFSRPYHELLHGEYNLLKSLESLLDDEQRAIISQMGTKISDEIKSGAAFKTLVSTIKALFKSEESCIISLIRDHDVGLHIDYGFFAYALCWDDTLRDEIFAEYGPRIPLILNNHYLPEIFRNLDSEEEAKLFQCLMVYVPTLATKNISQFKAIVAVINDENMPLFFNFFAAYLIHNPINFADFFDFIYHLTYCKQRQDFIAVLSKAHFSFNQSPLEFCKLIKYIHLKLNRKLTRHMLILFEDSLCQFIQNGDSLFTLLQSVSTKDQVFILEKLAPQLPHMGLNVEKIKFIINILSSAKSSQQFIHYLKPYLVEIVAEISDACFLASELNIDEQLLFLEPFEFEKEKWQLFFNFSGQNELLSIYLLIRREQVLSNGYGFFQSNYLNLLKDVRRILCEPSCFTTAEILEKTSQLPEHLKFYFELPFIHRYLMAQAVEFNQSKFVKID